MIMNLLKKYIFTTSAIKLLGVVNPSITYYFEPDKKIIWREYKNKRTSIDEPTLFMELDNHVIYTSNGYILKKEADEIAKNYLYLKNGSKTEYARAVLAFECFNSNFKIVIHFGQLLLRWYGGYSENNRQKEAVVLVQRLPEGFTKWDLREYEDVIRNQLKAKEIGENEFDSYLKSISLPETIRNLSFTIALAEGGRYVNPGCTLEYFNLYKAADDIIQIRWSVGFRTTCSHNPGAGGCDPVPDIYFQKKDKVRFAEYIVNTYNQLCGITKEDILYNSEIETLFSLIHDCAK